ncbi:MAG TPA: hypothetical protein VF590_25840 [Isosphaeraceae bacterium]|jgi:methylmalonyl-CoA carboxyltransferase large subunit
MTPTGANQNLDLGDWASVAAALGALRQEVARLGRRVAALEAGTGSESATEAPRGTEAAAPEPAPVAAAAAAAAAAPQVEGLSEELVLVIGAAVAAFLGKRAPIRQIRLLGSAAWAQQGRVTIQASHALSVPHARS